MLFTSEAVASGHPDKIADQIADAILDECLRIDPKAHVACECFLSENFLFIGGEITMQGSVDYRSIARNKIKEIGYTDPDSGFKYDEIEIELKIKEQSPNIYQAVTQLDQEEIGAGDQGIVFGYAVNETASYLPLAYDLANQILKRVDELRVNEPEHLIKPDAKSQVTISYDENQKLKVHTILLSVSHGINIDHQAFNQMLETKVIDAVLKQNGYYHEDINKIINPSGEFSIYGPKGDTGLTGRKIIADSYGGYGHHGGGSFSGKDPSKVDRSAAYYARYIAKNLVAAKVADRIEVELAYAIGMRGPLSININTFGCHRYPERLLEHIVITVFHPTVSSMIEELSLINNRPFRYQDLAKYGHFGRDDLDLPWEKTDRVSRIMKSLRKF
ncbi:MAG: methionine adenosyltransferase [Erysipelotrichaceae bacterium]|jgi:S-adenosylmethionine synthetase|nr:methionine adenosyltransferase [Erysipelotrichaceae bacterium]